MDEFVCAQYTFVNCVIGFEFWNATLTKDVELIYFDFVWKWGSLRYHMAALTSVQARNNLSLRFQVIAPLVWPTKSPVPPATIWFKSGVLVIVSFDFYSWQHWQMFRLLDLPTIIAVLKEFKWSSNELTLNYSSKFLSFSVMFYTKDMDEFLTFCHIP